jgi:membrane fusion protein, multidrug efflux system
MANKLALVALTYLGVLTASCNDAGHANSEPTPVVHASTSVIQLRSVPDTFQAPGTIRARTSTVLSSKIVGQIVSLNVREGDRVRPGQVVAEIDNREANNQLRRSQAAVAEAQRGLDEAERGIQAAHAAARAAETNRDLAESTRKRYDVLRERRSVSPQEFDEVDAKYKAAALEAEQARENLGAAEARRLQISSRIEQAEAEVETARVSLGYSKIASPIDGIVTARRAEPGMLASPGMPLIAIDDDRTYELEATVEESNAGRVTIGQPVPMEIDALPGITMEGRVREIVPTSDPATRTYTVKVQITTAHDSHLRSGFFGRALFSAGDRQALVIPESALTRRGQLEGVYIVENGAALRRLIRTGKHYGENIEVLSGLAPGTRIVTTPTAEITDGVKIIDSESAGKTP